MWATLFRKLRRSTAATWFKASVLGLQCKSTVLVVALTLCVAALVGGLFIHLSGRLTARLQEQHSIRSCALLAQLAAEPLTDGDHAQLTELARKFATGDPLLFVVFCDADGRPLVSACKDGTAIDPSMPALVATHRQTIGEPILRKGHPGSPAYLDVSYPVNRISRVSAGKMSAGGDAASRHMLIGYVRVGFNVDPMLKELASVIDLVSGIALIVVLITIPLAFLVVRQIVVPLNELSRTAGRLAKGDLAARSGVNRTDEIGQLAQAFNHMADEIARHEAQITAMNVKLEERVRQRTRQLREMAARDPLTGLYNRRHFDEMLVRSFSEARRYGHPLSCLMIDLDDFKAVNDEYGHHTGDKALILASVTIVSQLRASDVAARFGGDEFVVLLPHTDNEQAQVLGQRIAEQFVFDKGEQLPHLDLGLSIGVASLFEAGADLPEALVRAADQALYEAKQHGKNRIEISKIPI